MSETPALLTDERKETLKKLYFTGATDAEFDVFCYTVQRTGLSPEARQIYAIKKGEKILTIVSIDGFRLIAQRSGQYAGQMGPYFKAEINGPWLDCWPYDKPPLVAKVGVLRHDFKEPLYATARWGGYAQQSQTWKKMPDLMLAKCAESLALRRAFPQDLSGLYGEEEMDHVIDDVKPVKPHEVPEGVISGVLDKRQLAASLMKKYGIQDKDVMVELWNLVKDLGPEEMEHDIRRYLLLKEHPDALAEKQISPDGGSN